MKKYKMHIWRWILNEMKKVKYLSKWKKIMFKCTQHVKLNKYERIEECYECEDY